MFKKILSPVLMSLTLTGFSGASFGDDWPDDIRNAGPAIDLLNESVSYTGSVDFYSGYEDKNGVVSYLNPTNSSVSYTQYRHKIEGVIESPEDVDIIPVKIPHDLYMAFGAKVTSNQRDVVVNLLPANMLYSPLENGRGIYRDYGDEKEFTKHYKDITGSIDSRYFYEDGTIFYDGRMHPSITKEMFTDRYVYSDFIYAERSTTGGAFDFQKNRYKDDLYYYVINLKDRGEEFREPVSYILYQDFTDVPFESPQVATPYAENFESKDYKYIIAKSNYLNDDEVMIRYFRNNPEMQRIKVYPDILGYYKPKVYFNGDYNNPRSFLDIDWNVENGFEGVSGGYVRSPDASRECEGSQANCYKVACTTSNLRFGYSYTRYGHLSIYSPEYSRYPNTDPRKTALKKLSACLDPIKDAKNNGSIIRAETDRKIREGYLSNSFKTKFDNMLGYYNKFGLQVNTFEDAILINDTNALIDSDNLAGTEDLMEIRLFSLLGDRDPYVRESYDVDVTNERTGEVERVTVFESTCEEWKDFYKAEPSVSSTCFTGTITKKKSTTFENNDNELSVLEGDKILLETEDLYENDLYPSYTKVLKDSMTFTIKEMPELARFVDLPSSKSFEETVTLKIVDGNENKDTTEKDSVEVEVKVRNRFGGVTEDFSVVLEETGVNTGIFRKDIQSVLVSSSADIISDDEVFQFVGTDSEYSIEFRHTDQKSFFINEEFSIDNASSFFELGQIYQDEFEDADLSRVVSFEMDVLKNEDATISFYSSNNFELNKSHTLSLRDCNLYRQVESPEITFRNKTSGESYSFPLEQTSWNQCQYRTPSFYAYETEFKSVELPTSENMFANIDDEIVIEFLDPKGSNEQETLITSEFSVSGIYGSNANMLLGPEGYKQYNGASSIDNVYLMNGKNKTTIAIRDNDRRILGEAGLTLDVEIVNETKNSVYEFALPLEAPSCPDCNSNTFSSQIEFSSIENEGDVFAEDGDVIIFKYLDAGRSRDYESNVLISESFTILDATKTEIQIDEPVVLGKSNEIVVSDQDLSAWRDLLSYNEMRDYEVIRVTNTTNNESQTIGMNSFYSNESNGYLRLEKDIGQEYAKESNLLANVGDRLLFEFVDFFGEDGLNSIVVKEAVVEEGDFDDASIYTSDIMYQEDFTLYVEHMAANKDSNVIDTVNVELYMSDGYNGEYLNEKETLTLTETDVNSGIFELVVDPVYTNNATQENGVVELSVWANNSVDYLRRVTFVYEKETTGFRLTYDNYINFEVNGVFVQLDPLEDIKMKENLEIKVFNPLTTNYSINVDVVVTLLNGESWTFRKKLEREEEGVYSDVLKLSNPPENENPEDSFVCNDRMNESSVGERPMTEAQLKFTPYEESVLCAEDGATIEVFYDYGNIYSSEISITGVIPDPIMTVTKNLKVNDTAFVEVVDASGNVSAGSMDTVYGYVLVRKASSELVGFESVEDSFNIELESFELKETGIDTGVFVAEVPLSLRNKNSEAIYDNKELEVRSTVHDREFLIFAYNGLDPYGSVDDGPIIIPTASGFENELNSLSASVEDLVESENIYSFDGDYSSVTPFEFRDIDGGYNGTLSLEKDYVDVNSTQRVKVFDMDLVKSGKTVTTVTLSNERSGFEKDFALTLNPLTGYYSELIEFVDENNFENQGGFRVQPNDIVEVKYLDEKREDNSEKEVVDQFEMLSGADAFLNASQRIFVKDTVSILLKDSDIIGQETAVVTVLNQRTNETESVTLNVDEEDSVFLGSLNVTYGDTIAEEGVMGVNAEDNLMFTYVDEENSSDAPRDVTIQRTVFSGTTGVLSMPRFVYIEDGINQVIDVLLTDYDLNNSVDERESVDVTIENIDTGESKVITLTEDGVNSSSFLGALYFDENFTISDKDELRGSYLDEMTETGETVDVEAFSEIIGSEGSFSGILNVPEEIDIGETMTLSVTDSDNNNNSTEKESLTVVVKNTRSEVEKVIELFETDVDTGVFTGILETSLESSELEETIMGVIKNDVLQTEYFDEANVDGNPVVVNKSTLVISGFDAEMTVADPVKVNQTVGVSVKDADENKDASVVEDIVVTVINQRTNQEVQLKMTETGVDTGRFSSGLETEYSEEPLEGDVMGVVANDEIVFSYTDKLTSKGGETVISETRTLLGGFDAVLEVEENVFVGKPVEVKVVDEDENELSSEIEKVTVNIRNERTNQIISIELIETSTDSGVFVGDFDTEYNEEITQENVISVINDDQVVVSYEDQFNSDGGTTTIEEIVTFIAGFDGEISVTSPNEIGNAMIITVRDRDLDVSKGADTVLVVVTNERTKESVEVLLTEQVAESRERTKAVAANSSNPFVGMVYGVNEMVGFGKGSELETFSGDYLVASYLDEINSQGQSETLTAKGLFLGADAIVLDKNALEDSAVVGGLMPYTIEVENVSPNDLTNVEIIDNLPAGFRLAKDFVYVGDDKEPVSSNGGVMTVTLDEIESNETIVLTYVLKVSSGVVEGAYENKVKPYIGNILVGNEARATVYIQDDPLFNDALVFGKVFNDVNGNGYLDNGEEGIPGVTIAGVDGINVVTDSKGRYSIEGIDGGRMDRGVNYILKVMPETLPEGSEFTTENPRVQRITQGMPSKFNFGVAVPKQGAYTAMVEVRLGEVFFDWDKDNVKEEYESSLNRIANFIEEQGGGIIIIEGNTDSLGTNEYNEDLALRRASAVYKVLKDYLSDEVYQNIEVKIIK